MAGEFAQRLEVYGFLDTMRGGSDRVPRYVKYVMRVFAQVGPYLAGESRHEYAVLLARTLLGASEIRQGDVSAILEGLEEAEIQRFAATLLCDVSEMSNTLLEHYVGLRPPLRLIEMLKFPTCVGVKETIVFTELRARLNQLDGSERDFREVWELVHDIRQSAPELYRYSQEPLSTLGMDPWPLPDSVD